MTESKPNKTTAWCKGCKRHTNHDVLASHPWVLEDDYYMYREEYKIVRCCGCDNVSFLLTVFDESNETIDDYGNSVIEAVEHIFPTDKLLVEPIDKSKLPIPVREIYSETIECINRKNFILGAAGCRAVIEAICKEHKIQGGNLNSMINNMAKSHIITAKDRDHLHAIRFMGNDSIHVSQKYPQKELVIVAHIINTILTSLYVIAEESRKLQQHPIDTYQEFLNVLNIILNETRVGEERTLKQLTKSKRTILEDYLSSFEPQLISDINAGSFTRLSLVPATNPQKFKVETPQENPT